MTSGIKNDVAVAKAWQTIEVDFTPKEHGLTLFHSHNQFRLERGVIKLFNVI